MKIPGVKKLPQDIHDENLLKSAGSGVSQGYLWPWLAKCSRLLVWKMYQGQRAVPAMLSRKGYHRYLR